jgi:hypothetical protein
MARIPLGNAGNATPGQVRAPQIQEAGVQSGRALEQMGAVGVQSGIVKEQDRLRGEWQIAEEERRKQEAAAEAAARAKDTNTLLLGEDKLRDLHDQIGEQVLSGSLPKDQAATRWAEESKKIVGEVMPGLRDTARPLAEPHFTRLTNTLGNGVRKSVEKRDRQDVTTSLDSILETAQRGYARDPQGMTAMVESAAAQLGGQSLYTPEQLGKKVQAWKEDTQYTVGFAAVEAARNDRKALDNVGKVLDGLPDLDPQKRATLLDKVADARMRLDQKAELQAQRAQRQAEAHLNRAEATFTAATALSDKGVLAPEFADKTVAALAGTPFQAAFRALVDQQAQTGNLAALPIAAQRRALDETNAKIAQSGITPQLEKRRTQLEGVYRGSVSDLEKDPLRAGLERGVIADLKPINMGNGLQTVVEQIRTRTAQADVVRQWAGRNVSPLTADESTALKTQLDALPAKERSMFISTLATTLGPQASQGLAEQMDGKDRALALAFSMAGSQTTYGRMTSELILKGQQAKQDGTSTKGEKKPDVEASKWRTHAAAELTDVFPNAKTSTQIRDAAELIMHGMAAEAGGRLQKSDMDRAVGLALGGTLAEHNGKKIPLPAGVELPDLERSLERITAATLEPQTPGGKVRAGGVEIPVADFAKQIPGQQLMPVRPGEFAVIVQGRPVVNVRGEPIIVKVR